MSDLQPYDLKEPVPEGLSEREEREWRYQRYIKEYLRVIAALDENVGRVLHFLEIAGLSEDTAVAYTSDHGFFLGEHGWFDKRFMYEPSMRIPLVVRWPGVVAPGSVERRPRGERRLRADPARHRRGRAARADAGPQPAAAAARRGPRRLAHGGVLPLLHAPGPGPQRPGQLRHPHAHAQADPLPRARLRRLRARARSDASPSGSCSTSWRTRTSCTTATAIPSTPTVVRGVERAAGDGCRSSYGDTPEGVVPAR